MELLIGLSLGGFIAWLITHKHYQHTNKAPLAVYNKLAKDIRIEIIKTPKVRLKPQDIQTIVNKLDRRPVVVKMLQQ